MDKLERYIKEGISLDEDQQKDLARLKSLPNQFPDISDILGLNPPECREWKRLNGKRQSGDKMTPEELQRYRFLKDKIKKAQEEEDRKNRPPTPPAVDDQPLPCPASPQQANKQVTFPKMDNMLA